MTNNVKAQNACAKSLIIGNKWIYITEQLSYYSKKYEEVIRDTIIDQKRYGIIKIVTDSSIGYEYQRSDTNCIYKYRHANWEFPAREDTLVNYNSNVGDSLGSYLVKSKNTISFWGKEMQEINMYYDIPFAYYSVYYLKGVGVKEAEGKNHGFPEVKSYLKAALLENKVYGDSTLVSVKKIDMNPPSISSLYQNYPNPFNPSTIINYSLPKQSNVRIIVYDMLGREISTLINEEKSAGNYSITFDGNSLTSGIYFYQIKANEFVQTKKMLLLK